MGESGGSSTFPQLQQWPNSGAVRDKEVTRSFTRMSVLQNGQITLRAGMTWRDTLFVSTLETAAWKLEGSVRGAGRAVLIAGK